jgi:hypothetical protein
MEMSGQLHSPATNINNLLNANKSFENVAKFKPLGTTVTNQKYIYEEIKSILHSTNSCYHSGQSLSSRLPYKNLNI